ncbi:MAG: biotin/lipoyl-binding protein [Alphaproteobacteria bacterium]|nr:biotin/lipoyl-binding protein [Alphaproteobacteria bacterium]
MLEFLFCSLLTIVPDFLIRRYAQGKRWGRELTLYSIWFELRWGITACLLLTVGIITIVFYYHPSTSNVTSFFRTITILPEAGGRVSEVFVRNNQKVAAGEVLFTLDDVRQLAAVNTSSRRVAEIEAAIAVAEADLLAAAGQVAQAAGAYQVTFDELARKQELAGRNSPAVSKAEIDRLTGELASRRGALEAARAQQTAVEKQIAVLLPAQRASAIAALQQAEVELDKMVIYAGVAGTVEQFALQPGDFVSPVLRPAGILVPSDIRQRRFQAGFDQLAAQVLKVGMIAEISCMTHPFKVFPMVVVEIQDVISAGQFRPTDQLRDVRMAARPGSITAFLEPLYVDQDIDVLPGSACSANAYTDNHALLEEGGLGAGTWMFYHLVDTVGFVHAVLLRARTLLLPIRALVFSGH